MDFTAGDLGVPVVGLHGRGWRIKRARAPESVSPMCRLDGTDDMGSKGTYETHSVRGVAGPN